MLPFLAVFQLAVAAPPERRVFNGRAGETSVVIPRVAATIQVDGLLDEPVWRSAALLTGFSVYQPVDNQPAPDSTEVLVWYSADAIHFGIRAFEPHGVVNSSVADRDHISANDNVEIHLDPFAERNRALVFIVNPVGVQADGTKGEGGGFIPGSNVAPGQNDLSADFSWESKGHVTDWGYEVEILIPFSSMRYPIAAVQDWGLQIDRRAQHNAYEETWTPAVRANASFISQEGWLRGMTGMRHGQVVEINPELVNTVNGLAGLSFNGNPAPKWKYQSNPQAGGNLRWTLGSDFVLNGTYKPDFSQVEADAAQIAADQRFALFYPEKRPFFVEGSDQFNVPNTLVYTRRIIHPDEAVKLTGKLGSTDIAVLSALDDRSSSTTFSRPLVDIVRMRQAIGSQSNAGFLYSERVTDSRANRVLGADAHIVFGRLYYFQAQVVGSATRDTTHASTNTAPMWEAVVDRTGRSFGFHYAILGSEAGFRADNGFVQRTGIVMPGIHNRFTWYGKPGHLFERYNVFIHTSGIWRYGDFFSAKSLLEDQASIQNTLTLRGGWSVNATPALSSYAFDPQSYRNLFVQLPLALCFGCPPAYPMTVPGRTPTFTNSIGVATPQFQRYDASVNAVIGNDVDFLDASRIRRRDLSASVNLRPTTRLRVNATYVASSYTRRSDGVESFSSRIPRLKVEYQVARPLFVRIVSQYQAAERRPLVDPASGAQLSIQSAPPSTYVPTSTVRSNSLRADWLISYRPSPGTVAFFGYGNTLAEPEPLAFRDLRRTSDAFFVKLSYLFRVIH